MMPLQMAVHTQLSDLEALRPQWEALYQRVGAASVFTSPGWVMNWLQAFAARDALVCITLSAKGTLCAVLPLVRVATRWRRVPLQALTPCTNAHSVRSAWLFDPQWAAPVADALQQNLRRQRHWDLLLLDGCDVADGATATADAPLHLPALRSEVPASDWQHSVLRIEGPWSAYFATRSRDLRRNVRRSQEGLSLRGPVEARVDTRMSAELLADWIAIDRASWKAQRGETVDATPTTLGYYRGMLQAFSDAGQLLVVTLCVAGTPVANVVCAFDKGVCYTLKTAVREDFCSAHVSPGLLVMYHLLMHVWALPEARRVDFVSKQAYTERWSLESQTFQRRAVFAKSLRGQLSRALECYASRARPPATL